MKLKIRSAFFLAGEKTFFAGMLLKSFWWENLKFGGVHGLAVEQFFADAGQSYDKYA